MNYIIVASESPKRRRRLQEVTRKAIRGLDVRPMIRTVEPVMNFKGYLAQGIREENLHGVTVIFDAEYLWDEEWFVVVADFQRHQFKCQVIVINGKHGNKERVLHDDSIVVLNNPDEIDFIQAVRNLIN